MDKFDVSSAHEGAPWPSSPEDIELYRLARLGIDPNWPREREKVLEVLEENAIELKKDLRNAGVRASYNPNRVGEG